MEQQRSDSRTDRIPRATSVAKRLLCGLHLLALRRDSRSAKGDDECWRDGPARDRHTPCRAMPRSTVLVRVRAPCRAHRAAVVPRLGRFSGVMKFKNINFITSLQLGGAKSTLRSLRTAVLPVAGSGQVSDTISSSRRRFHRAGRHQWMLLTLLGLLYF